MLTKMISPYGFTRPQWVKYQISRYRNLHNKQILVFMRKDFSYLCLFSTCCVKKWRKCKSIFVLPQNISGLDTLWPICILFQPLVCCPAMTYFHGRRERECKLLLRGDSEGRVTIWTIPEISDNKLKLVRQESFDRLPGMGQEFSRFLRLSVSGYTVEIQQTFIKPLMWSWYLSLN